MEQFQGAELSTVHTAYDPTVHALPALLPPEDLGKNREQKEGEKH